MTKAKLKQLRHLSKEIELLKQQIEGLETVVVTDKVKGSLSEHPYIETTYTIKGLVHERSAKVERLKKQLQRRVDELMDLRQEVYEFVETIDDSLIRQVVTLRHINGLTWRQIARTIGAGTTWNSLRMMHDRFLEKL